MIDTSALLAILADEPERAKFAAAIEADPNRLVSAVTIVEASLVLESRYGSDAVDDLDLLLTKIAANVVPFGPSDVAAARAAYQRFGKGHHAAALNLGDCFSYALSLTTGEALLFKGSDFTLTDLRSALS